MFLRRLLIGWGVGWSLMGMGLAQPATRTIPINGGFEDGTETGNVVGWSAYETGFDLDRQVFRHGGQSLRCDSLRTNLKRGASTRLELNQKRPLPILVTGWSRAEKVEGGKNPDYSLYVDIIYADGTPQWGLSAPFTNGTHDWERRRLLVLPEKPIKTLTLYALFRNHTGTAWFDDLAIQEMTGSNLFDSQPLTQPLPRRSQNAVTTLTVKSKDGLSLGFTGQGEIASVQLGGQEVRSEATGGFFVRDVAADSPLTPMRNTFNRRGPDGLSYYHTDSKLRLRFSARLYPEGDALMVDGEVSDGSKTDRAITIYLALPVEAVGWNWGQDIRRADRINSTSEYSNQVRVNVGATGSLSLYPFGSLSNEKQGLGIASEPDWPTVSRIFYNGATRQFVVAWDFALTAKTAAWPSHSARFRCRLFRLAPSEARWGFRAAAQRYFRLNRAYFTRRAKADGIWMPFTDPATVQNAADFGFAYHEGDNSLKSDDALGILSFRYTEPMSYWFSMAPSEPRTYENTLRLLQKQAEGTLTGERVSDGQRATPAAWARAVLNSGTQDENGRYILEFRNEPWANGAVFTLNPNPELPNTPEQPTRASLAYTFSTAQEMYGPEAIQKRGEQDGEYLDSLESWSDVQDYRYQHLRSSPYPLPFDTDSLRPTLPQWFSTHAFTRFLRDDLRNRNRLLMANTTPVRFSCFAPLLDVMGIEVNWLDGGAWRPDSDATMNLRRTLSYQKPYLLLMNTDFAKFGPFMERYFQTCLFYGIFPSMFSIDAASNPYWENRAWYNRDRPLFQRYIPLIKRLSAAGWEPITHARSSNPMVAVERFGTRLFTLRNLSSQPQTTNLTLDIRRLGLPNIAALQPVSLLTGATLPAQRTPDSLTLSLSLQSDEVLGIELK